MKTVSFVFLLISCFCKPSLAGNTSDLPFGPSNIILKSFSGTSDGRIAKLSWDFGEMENEVTCTLERSDDGIRFIAIETFKITKGFTGLMSSTDKRVNIGLYYYRLHVEKLGFRPYTSNVISIRINKGEELVNQYKVENPFRQQLTIRGNFSSNPVVIEIADINGRVRLVKNINGSANHESISIPSSNLEKGVYILRIKEERNGSQLIIMTKRIIKDAE